MAKTKKTAPEATVGSVALQKIGGDALSRNPHLAGVFVTSDGTAFALENDAVNHTSLLRDKAVLKVARVIEEVEIPEIPAE